MPAASAAMRVSLRTTCFSVLTASVMAAVLIPRLARRVMFLDGLTYASIARNLAEGRGRFWAPQYTTTIYPAFHEHPPLGIWLESLLFRAFGDHLFVERLYCALAAVAVAAIVAWTWRALEPRELAWLPVLLWIAVPVVSWAFVGNLLETTVSVFVVAAVGVVLWRGHRGRHVGRAVRGPGAGPLQRPDTGRVPLARGIGVGAISGAFVVLAALTKGPVGLFPLAAPFALWLLPDRRRDIMPLVAGQWAAVGLAAAALWAVPAARQSLSAYVGIQLLPALTGHRETAGAPGFVIVSTLLLDVVLTLAVALAVLAIAAGRWQPPSRESHRTSLFFLAVGLAGTLPLAISPKQAGYYLVPAVPFYALAAAALAVPTAARLAARVAAARVERRIELASAVLAACALAAVWVPTFRRHDVRQADLDRLAAVLPRGATIGICPAVNGDWGLHALMQREFEVSLDASPTALERTWFLNTTHDEPNCSRPAPCAAVARSGAFTLLKCG
jgi:4-amino-4-deoxy-L-arabinose transferase-like glycosyltransferase